MFSSCNRSSMRRTSLLMNMHFTSLGIVPKKTHRHTNSGTVARKGWKWENFDGRPAPWKNQPYPSAVKVPKNYFKITSTLNRVGSFCLLLPPFASVFWFLESVTSSSKMKQVHVQEAGKSSSTDDKMFKKLRQDLNSGRMHVIFTGKYPAFKNSIWLLK